MAEAVLRAKKRTPNIPDDIPSVEYPEEVIDRLNKEAEIARMQLATGELKPETVKEFAARYGITVEDNEH